MATAKRQSGLSEIGKVRLDKWLWAARFFKTRKLAGEAISGGRVHVNNVRVKPAKTIGIGDQLEITKGPETFEIEVVGLNDKRRPASEAGMLYIEGEESINRREAEREARKMAGGGVLYSDKRPDKRQRRQIRDFKGR